MLFAFFALLTLLISWNNARVSGREWVEAKAAGGFARALAWSGAIMSACGFTTIFAVLVVGYGHLLFPGTITSRAAHGVMDMTVVLIGLPLLGSGILITLESLMRAWRERSGLNIAVAAWNAWALADNAIWAATTLPDAASRVWALVSSEDDGIEDRVKSAVIAAGVGAVAIGGFVTFGLMRAAMAKRASEIQGEAA